MKIRIKGNSLRLRLSQSEIEKVKEEGRVSDSISFGNQSQLIYSLQVSDSDHVTALYQPGFITVNIPKDIADTWVTTEQVGFDAQQPIGSETLYILIEKDFQCLKPRPDEDETDLYTNPNQYS